MLDRSVEVKPSKGRKRLSDEVSENKDVSPPKICGTPRTRSKVIEETTPKYVPVPVPRSSVCKTTGPVSKTPIHTPKSSGPVTRTPVHTPKISGPGAMHTQKTSGPVTRTPIHTQKTSGPVTRTPIQAPKPSEPVTRTPIQTPKTSGPVTRTPIQTPKSSGPVTRTPIHTPKTDAKGNFIETLKVPEINLISQSNMPVTLEVPETRSRSRSNTPVSLEVPKTRSRSRSNTPVTNEVLGCGKKRSRSITPVTKEVQQHRTRSRSNTPVTCEVQECKTKVPKCNPPVTPEVLRSGGRRSRSKTPVTSKVKLSTNSTSAHVMPTLAKPTPKPSGNESEHKMAEQQGLSRTPIGRTRNSSKYDITPKIPPHAQRTPRSKIMVHATPKEPKVTQRKSRTKTPVFKASDVTEPDMAKSITESQCLDKNSSSECSQDALERQGENIRKDNTCNASKEGTDCIKEYKGQGSSQDSQTFKTNTEPLERTSSISPECGETSPIETNAHECSEFNKELEKVKKRRSTVGRGRKSGQSIGGRRSLCPAIPILSLEDQIANIDKGLPHTSKVSHLIDISLREAMRRLEERFRGEECIPDLRLDVLTNSEIIGGDVAYKIAGLPLEVESCLPKKWERDSEQSIDRMSAYKNRTKELEQEYRCWKSLLKERKLACQVAEREFREAKSGETKIEEDIVKNLTSVQRNILSGRPDYSQYIKEVQMARERSFFILQEANHTVNVIANFMTASKAVAETCYAAIEEMTFGSLKQQPVKSALNTLIHVGEEYTK